MTQNIKYDINFFGLDNAGKSSLIRALVDRESKLIPLKPTKGFDYKTYDFMTTTNCCRKKVVRLSLVDTGGQESVRDFWPKRFGTGAATVFVLDASDDNRYQEAFDEIRRLLYHNEVASRPFMVFANKQDLECKIRSQRYFSDQYGMYTGLFATGSIASGDDVAELLYPLFEAAIDPKRLAEAQRYYDLERYKVFTYGMNTDQKWQKLAELYAAKQ